MHLVSSLVLLALGFIAIASGQNQACVTLPCNPATAYADIAILLDSSQGSINPAYFDSIKQFFRDWTSDYTLGGGVGQTQFAFVTYSNFAILWGYFSDSWNGIGGNLSSSVIDHLFQTGTTRDLAPGLNKVFDDLTANGVGSGYRPNAKHILVVFSSNTFTGPSWASILASVAPLEDVILSVGLTPNSINAQQVELVSLTKGQDPNATQFIAGPDQLGALRTWLNQQICVASAAALTKIASALIFRAGASNPSNTNFCVSTLCPPQNVWMDIAVIFDESSSLTSDYFLQFKQMLRDWGAAYTIGALSGQVQFGYVGMAQIALGYGFFSANSSALNVVIDTLTQTGGTSRILEEAVDRVTDYLTAQKPGSAYRPAAKHLAVIFSGAPFTDSAYMNAVNTMKVSYERVLGVSLQYPQTDLYGQLTPIVTGSNVSNIFMISGQNGLNAVLTWLIGQGCSM